MTDFVIERGRAEDYEDLIDFGDLVFRTRFTETAPILYHRHPEAAKLHYLVREAGRVKAMLAARPFTLHAGEHTLAGVGIGTVSVHPRARGRGYMRALMWRAIEDARRDGADFLILGGQRQRYGYYGFEPCGMRLRYGLGPGEMRRLGRDRTLQSVPLVGEWLDRARALYAGQLLHVERGDFLGALGYECAVPRAIVRGGDFIGYYAIEGRDVREFYVADPRDALEGAMCAVDGAGEELTFLLQPDQAATASAIAAQSDSSEVTTGAMVLPLDFARMAGAFLALRAQLEGIVDGRMVLEAKGVGCFALEARGGKVRAVATQEEPEVSMTPRELTRYLFSPDGALLRAGKRSPLERDWFPLPLCVPEQDEI